MRPPVIPSRSRIVFDTASFITALRSRVGAARKLLDMLLDGEIVAVMDYKLGQEYRDVALRPEHLSAANLSAVKVLILIETLEDRAEFVEVGVRQRPLSQDPDDDMILELAIHGKVDAIVTSNVKHMRVPASRFGIATLTPAEWLEEQRKEKYVH